MSAGFSLFEKLFSGFALTTCWRSFEAGLVAYLCILLFSD
jgi:hypothetical protein